MKINVLIIAVLLFVLIFGCRKSSDDHNTLSFDEIKNKLESAQDGDTVIIPAGTLTIKNSLTINKNITLKGEGIDKTVILSDINTSEQYVITVVGNNNTPVRITGITFKGVDGSQNNKSYGLLVSGICSNFRIDHCKFTNGGSRSITIHGYIYGVIDHCEFLNAADAGVVVLGGGNGNAAWGDKDDYNDKLGTKEALGTAKAVFVEDCNFKNENNTKRGEFIASNNGSRYVFRYNYALSASGESYSPADAHGNFDYKRGSYSVEIYGNTFEAVDIWVGINIRGGTGVIYNNKFKGTFAIPICFTDYRSFRTKSYYQGFAGGKTLYPNWTELADENGVTHCPDVSYSQDNYCDNVYPAPDQVNNFYVWDNTYNGAALTDGTPKPYVQDRGLDRAHIQKGRDYFEYAMPGYTPYTYPHPLTKQ